MDNSNHHSYTANNYNQINQAIDREVIYKTEILKNARLSNILKYSKIAILFSISLAILIIAISWAYRLLISPPDQTINLNLNSTLKGLDLEIQQKQLEELSETLKKEGYNNSPELKTLNNQLNTIISELQKKQT